MSDRNVFKNYGDVDFFENGLLVRQDGDTEFSFIICEPIWTAEDKYLFCEGSVDTSDEWIKWKSIGVDPKAVPAVDAAIAVYEYYGSYEISAGYQDTMGKQEIIDIMNDYDGKFDTRPWEK